MARVHAASTRSRAATIQGMARSVAHPAYARMVAAEPWLRKLVPVLVAAFVAILGAFAWLETQASQNEAVSAMAEELELVTSLSRSEIARLMAERGASNIGNLQAFLMTAIPPRLLADGRIIAMTDANGMVKAVVPADADMQDIPPGIDHLPTGDLPALSTITVKMVAMLCWR